MLGQLGFGSWEDALRREWSEDAARSFLQRLLAIIIVIIIILI